MISIKQIQLLFLSILSAAGINLATEVVAGNYHSENVSEWVDRILKEPSSPVTIGFDPLLMKSIPPADPTSKVELIVPPQINNRGTAELSYRFEMPPARNGMQPQLSIHYNSDAGSGVLAMGWDLYIPTIAATAAAGQASYLIGGKKMTGSGNRFYLRRETGFQRIIRNGSSPADYTWEVTDQKGTKYIYGLENKGILTGVRKENGSIVEWKLSRVEEVHGDYIEYIYVNNTIRIDSIKVGNKGEDPHTKIKFSYGNNLLTQIHIQFEDKKEKKDSPNRYKPLRSYLFNYEKNEQTGNTFLKRIIHRNSAGTSFATHTLDYYDDRENMEKLIAYMERTGNTELDSLLIDRTAKLYTVHNPLGGCFTMDYNYAPVADTLGKVTLPEEGIKGKLVMKSVRINDGIFNDGANTKNEFTYSQGKYSDSEQTFLGYGNVIIKQIDTRQDSTIYRHILRTYDASSYYTCGNLLREVTAGADTALKYKEETYEYYSYLLATNRFFNPLKYVRTCFYENNNKIIAAESFYKYNQNSYGSLSEYIYSDKGTLGNTGTGTAYNYKLKVDYLHHVSLYIVNLPTKVTVTGSDGKTYREIAASYDHLGQITQLTRTLDAGGTSKAITNIQYDEFGNTVWKTLPENDKGKRMTYTYLYDRDYNMYAERVEDSFGYRTEMEEYDYRYGFPRIVRDMNGYTLKRTLDDLGRPDTLLSPNEQESGKKYTVVFSYNPARYNPSTLNMKDSIKEYFQLIDTLFLDVPDSIYNNIFPEDVITNIMGESKKKKCFNEWIYDTTNIQVACDTIQLEHCFCADIAIPAYAVTRRYDYARPDDDIETVLFADGMGRIIQEKKDAEISLGTVNDCSPQTDKSRMIVSGRTFYDPFGRITETYYPRISTAGKTTFENLFDTQVPTGITYDPLDRVTKVTHPDGSEVTTGYSIRNGSIASTVNDGDVKTYYTNGSGLVTREEYGTTVTVFDYDPIGRLAGMTRGDDYVAYEYDLAGNRTKIISSKGGTTTLTYDKAGNMLSKQTGNLTSPEGGEQEQLFITYEYDYNRLIKINYPLNPENNVTYTYGNKNASHNRVGRIMLQEDASGAQEFFYARLGEISKIRRTVIIPNQAIATYVTQWQYDSWNRLTEIIYPDGEKVTYSYNIGGLLESVKGGKTYCYDYVSRLNYDKFEQRVYMKYGNGTATAYEYHEHKRTPNQFRVFGKNCTAILYGFTGFGENNNLGSFTYENKFGKQIHVYNYWNANLMVGLGRHDKEKIEYSISFRYDDDTPERRIKKEQHIEQDNFIFPGSLTIEEEVGQYNGTYDHNGNLTHIEPYNGTGILPTVIGEHAFLWDEENRLLALMDGSHTSHYLCDAQGNRVVKSGFENENVHLNALFSGGAGTESGFTVYVNPYMEVTRNGKYTKHFFIGNERVVSKTGDLESFGSDPRRIEYAGHDVEDVKIDYESKYNHSIQSIKDHYAAFDMKYYGKDNDDYVNGTGFCCDELRSSSLRSGNVDTDKEDKELQQYYYHTDYQESTLLLTDREGNEIQYLDYLPFGEPFIDKREGDWYTRYLFHGKEYDEETGFYYYDGRYYFPAFGVWLNVSSPIDRNTALSPYIFKTNNPKK